MMLHTTAAPTAAAVWSRLEDAYSAVDTAHRMAATKQFYSLQMREGDSVERYITAFRTARARLHTCGTILDETEAAEAFLASLPSSYEAFVTTQTGLIGMSKAAVSIGVGRHMSLTDVISNILAKEVKRDSHKRGSASSSMARALYVAKGKQRRFQKNPMSSSSQSNTPSGSNPILRKKGSCNWCRLPGHYKKECRKKQNGEPRRPPPESHVLTSTSKPSVLVTCEIYTTHMSETWFLDSGATHHVCYTKQNFQTYLPARDETFLVVGNNSRVAVLGTGTMLLITPQDFRVTLYQVYHVPDMIKNLVSLSSLLSTSDFHTKFDQTGCLITYLPDPACSIQAYLKEALYCLDMKTSSAAAAYISSASQIGDVSQAALWHSRLAHVNESKLISLHKSGLYRHTLPSFSSLPLCDACARGKSKVSAYSKRSAYRAAVKLELVHTDLCGPISAQSFGGTLYFMPFIDDYTRMSFVYFLHSKSQALEMFVIFLEMAERQSGNKLVKLRSDGGGELNSHALQEYCTNRGIVRQVTAPYSSSMNGVAEIRHQMLQYQARTMLLQAGLPIGYWAEAVNTANYILNMLPTSALQGQTPHELWTGHKPLLHHLCVFGAPAYAHIPESKRDSKFAARATKLILVGYMDDLRAYKLLHPQTHKATYSRSITVNEGAALKPSV